jgi:hypothetical protein
LFNKVDDKKNYVAAIVALFIAGLFFLFAVFSLPLVILSPQKFVLFFTISMISTLVGLAFLNGPKTYLKKLTIRKNRIATGVLLISIILSLYFSIISGSYLLSLLFCFVQLNSVMLFFCNTFPFGWSAMKSMFSGVKAIVMARF